MSSSSSNWRSSVVDISSDQRDRRTRHERCKQEEHTQTAVTIAARGAHLLVLPGQLDGMGEGDDSARSPLVDNDKVRSILPPGERTYPTDVRGRSS